MKKVGNEVLLLGQLDHPNIIKVYEAYLFEGQYCIITELCEGGSLSDLIKQGRRFTDRTIRAIMCKLMSALAYLH
jgi:calcium-dependent protein kinase